MNISISGQDKMCLLNGGIGGHLPDKVDFGRLENEDKIKEKIPMVTILQNALLEYGNERLDNIIINDLNTIGLETLEYHGQDDLYLIYELDDSKNNVIGAGGILRNVTFDSNMPVWKNGTTIKVKDVSNYYSFNGLDPEANKKATRIAYSSASSENCVVIKIQYGQIVGYQESKLVYPDELIVNAGKGLTTVFDSIKNVLGDYEYFYDVNGRFVFQRKKDYVQTLFSPLNGAISEPMTIASPYSYQFNDLSQISQISYSPKISDIKNIFSIQGERQGVDQKIPIQARYAIDKKPSSYFDYEGKNFYYTKFYKGKMPLLVNSYECDWREIIYQMAKDYYNNATKQDDFYYILTQRNSYVKNCKTGYETYYPVIYSFWRELYYLGNNDKELPIGYESNNYYSSTHKTRACWHKNVYTNPNMINFWFDFLDVGEGPLSITSRQNIGNRLKVETSKKTTTIFKNDTPEIIFYTGKQPSTKNTSYSYIWIPKATKNLFSVSSQAPSLISQANELIYKYCCQQETVSLTTIPIYHLEPNTRIYVEGIGDLIVSKIQYNLGNTQTMSLSCTRVVDSIY